MTAKDSALIDRIVDRAMTRARPRVKTRAERRARRTRLAKAIADTHITTPLLLAAWRDADDHEFFRDIKIIAGATGEQPLFIASRRAHR